MTEHHRRGVTRGYVWGLVFAVVLVAFSLLVASWSAMSLATGGGPISTPGMSLGVAALMILLCLVALAWGLWSQSIVLLRGRRSPSWPHVVVISVGGYLLWCLAGILAGLMMVDTWLSPYPVILGIIWGLASLLCWALLVRRVYTDRPTPMWPWERRGEPGPDWTSADEDPWGRPREDPDQGPRE